MSSDHLIDQEFRQRADLVHLNHAAVGAWPRRTANLVREFADENFHQGALDYPRWLGHIARLRRNLARMIGMPDSAASDIAITKNTADGVSMVAGGLPWRAGDNVVLPSGEFPSNRFPWQALAKLGVDVRLVDTNAAEDAEAALLSACNDRTRVLALSAVDYSRGFRYQLARLKSQMPTSALLCVDAIQQLGALRFDNSEVQADVITGGSHKWLLAPEGVGYFYCTPAVREQLSLQQYGWLMVDAPFDFDQHANGQAAKPAEDARRFEPGTINMMGAMALNASLEVLLEIGMDEVERRILAANDALSRAMLEVPGTTMLSSDEQARRSGIIVMSNKENTSGSLYKRLMDSNIYCSNRGGGIRFSPHCYLSEQRRERAVAEFARACGH